MRSSSTARHTQRKTQRYAPISRAMAELALDAGGERSRYFLARRGHDILVFDQGTVYTLAKPQPLSVETAVRHGETGGAAQALTAPMSGTLIKVNAREGDTFAERQTLAVLGAMKMEHAIVAPYAGRVTRVLHARWRCRAGRRDA